MSEQRNKGWIELPTLEPSSQFIVNFWTDTLVDAADIRVVSDEGTAQVRPWYVSRNENHWVVRFGVDDLFFTLLPAIFVFRTILIIMQDRFQARLIKN